MSDPRRVLLVGATGLVGGCVMEQAVAMPDLRLVALARREQPLPRGGRMEMLVAPDTSWTQAIAAIAPEAVVCALGTTWRQAGRDEQAFRAVDHDLVLAVARAARDAGASQFVLISSVGADRAARQLYLRTKAEVEDALTRLRFRRLDILRPGLLRGARSGETRWLERLGGVVSPLADLLMQGSRRKYRSVTARNVAGAALGCLRQRAAGRFVHEHDAICRLAIQKDNGR
ncbi:nucleoside-diphosphate sugar epimerase [Altererythrobacter sp. B11]|uniref:NAD(P)H-binding protein n=1 Tax=Altererythrobacter sp. B11 TaxID=2060312 RepID=UPI000DC71A8B|nr:NAD(P)H-binding protein [Altererythrobacter sp. B11]BBC73722.1 nucleoside-diphosphate sugar epimerase [Altererythrobacter sp. B11]